MYFNQFLNLCDIFYETEGSINLYILLGQVSRQVVVCLVCAELLSSGLETDSIHSTSCTINFLNYFNKAKFLKRINQNIGSFRSKKQ